MTIRAALLALPALLLAGPAFAQAANKLEGACERLVEMGMEHARQRVTFGEPIANRQAIQWMVADSAVEIEALRWLVLAAAWQVDQGLDSRQSQSMAKLYGGVKANEIVDRVLQMHGGMGYTWESDAHLYLERARVLEHVCGSRFAHLDAIAAPWRAAR